MLRHIYFKVNGKQQSGNPGMTDMTQSTHAAAPYFNQYTECTDVRNLILNAERESMQRG
jgi:hypothetical protein